MKYSTILFDADETLFDFTRSELFALQHSFENYGIVLEEHHIASYREINNRLWEQYEQGEIKQNFLKRERFNLLIEQYQLNIDSDAFSATYIQFLGQGSFLIDGAEALCKSLLQRGCRLAIITNGIQEVQLNRINRSNVRDAFEQIIVSEAAGAQKPDAAIFDYAFNRLGLANKEKCLIVGDSLHSDIQGGNNYGIDTCWYNPKQKHNDTTIIPTFEIKHLAELEKLLFD